MNLTEVNHRGDEQTREIVEITRNEELLRGHGDCMYAEAWKCAFAEYRLPLVKTPFLLIASQYDWYGLMVDQGGTVGSTHCFPDPQCPYYEYADEFAMRTQAGVQALPQVKTGAS